MNSDLNNAQQDRRVTPEARGKRVESLRRMTRTSRRVFAEKYGIPKTSIQNWEDAIGNGLTEKGARRLVSVLKSAGIICTFEWLMHGMGQSPQISEKLFLDETSQFNDSSSIPLIDKDTSETEKISQELLLFHQNYPRIGIDFIVQDDGMEPRFIKGEYVAGCKHFGKMMIETEGLDCIVQTAEGDIWLRHIKKIDKNGYCTLSCINPNTTVEKPILYEVELVSAAPVIWARRSKR